MSLASGVLLGADVVTGYVNPTGFQTAREQGTSTEKIFLTVGHEYKNNNHSVVSGAVLNTPNRQLLSNGKYSRDRIFMPTGLFATGIGLNQGSFVTTSGNPYYLNIYATGADGKFDANACSIARTPRGLVMFKNEEPVGGYSVEFGERFDGDSGTVDKVVYNDSAYFYRLTPQSHYITHVGGDASAYMFVACTGHLETEQPKAKISYSLLPN